MNLKITSQISTSTGSTTTDAVGFINAHTGELLKTGQVPCDLKFYISKTDFNNGMDNFIAVTLNKDGKIQQRVASSTITLTEKEALAADLPGTIYNKVAEKLSSDYGWDVEVEA